jgi:spermidine synthase
MFNDAAAFLRESDPSQYDVIICDSSDPVGPAEVLFQPQFYESMLRALKPGGVLCTQGECQWLHLELITSVVKACADIFGTVEYAYTAMPTYPSGQLGFLLASVDEGTRNCL